MLLQTKFDLIAGAFLILQINTLSFASEELEYSWIIAGGTSTNLGYQIGESSNLPSLQFNVQANKLLNPKLALMSGSSFQWSGGNVDQTSISLLFGIVYNFSPELINSPYFSIGPGLFHLATTDSSFLTFLYAIAFGKRFEIFSQLSWSPEIGIFGNLRDEDPSSGSTLQSATSLTFTPVKFSFLLK